MDNDLLCMQGYLYVEEKFRGEPTGSYVLRYFILHPYCGLHWFEEKPKTAINGNYFENGMSGWVFGGNVGIDEVIVEEAVLLQDDNELELFPFIIILKCEQSIVQVRFASEENSTRQIWIDDLRESAKILMFVNSCCKFGASPSQRHFQESFSLEKFKLENTILSSLSLNGIVDFICNYKFESSRIKIVELNNCELTDSYTSTISALLSCMNLESFSLASNYLSCSCMVGIAEALGLNTNMTSLDLSSNLIGDKGCEAIALAAVRLNRLAFFNISRNRLTESSIRPLTNHVSRHSSTLRMINLSYNQLGDTAAAIISLLMYNQPSHLEGFDISFCGIQDLGLKEISAALSHCSTLQLIVAKGCYVEHATLAEFMDCVSKHQQNLFLRRRQVAGGSMSGTGTWRTGLDKSIVSAESASIATASMSGSQRLAAAIALNSSVPGGTLSVHFGGLAVQGKYLRSLPFKAFNTSLPYAGNSALLRDAVLRRRLQLILQQQDRAGDTVFTRVVSSTSSLSYSQLHAMPIELRDKFASVSTSTAILCMQVLFTPDMASAEEFLHVLADCVHADLRQFRVLACSQEDYQSSQPGHNNTFLNIQSHGNFLSFVTILVNNPTASLQKRHRQRLFYPHLAHVQPVEVQDMFDFSASPGEELPPAEVVLQRLYQMARQGSPKLVKMGVRSVFLQAAPFVMTLDKHGNVDANSGFFDPPTVSLNCIVKRSLPTATDGSPAEMYQYMPKISPTNMTALVDEKAIDTDDEDEFDYSLWVKRAAEDPPISKSVKYIRASKVAHQTSRSLADPTTASKAGASTTSASVSLTIGMNSATSVQSGRFVQSLAGDVASAVTGGGGGGGSTMSKKSVGIALDGGGSVQTRPSHSDSAPRSVTIQIPGLGLASGSGSGSGSGPGEDLAALRKAREAMFARVVARRERRVLGESLIRAVRELRRQDKMDSPTAQFWEGLLGNKKLKGKVDKILERSLGKHSLFHGVRLRFAVSDAMLRQDLSLLITSVEALADSEFDGGLSLQLGHRMISHLVSIQHEWTTVSSVAKHFDQIDLVEDFLVVCARLGYRGNETMAAIQLRQQLITAKVAERPTEISDTIEIIKRRAFVANLMISRDFDIMSRSVEDLRMLRDDGAYEYAELAAARQVLGDYEKDNNRLKRAVENSHMGDIEDAVALASYHSNECELLTKAVTRMTDLCRSPLTILHPLVQALREGDLVKVDLALAEVHRVGWSYRAVTVEYAHAISAMRHKLQKDDLLCNNLIKVSQAMKNGLAVNIGEMMRLYNRAVAERLHLDSFYKPHVDILEKKAKKLAALGKQEQVVRKMIAAKNIKALTTLLSGRGTGKLVMCAPNEELLQLWMARISSACEVKAGGLALRHSAAVPGLNPGGGTSSPSSPQSSSAAPPDSFVLMSGTMEKSARNDKGKVGNWKRRFFVLQNLTLTYFVRSGGEKKGVVRVKGGRIRRMDPRETGGRPLCMELQEGRDISVIDPDLIEQANQIVRAARREDLEHSLIDAISRRKVAVLSSILAQLEELQLTADFALVTKAKRLVNEIQLRRLRKELLKYSRIIPKGRMNDIIRRADALHMDACNPLLQQVMKLADKAEPMLSILRALNALEMHDDRSLRRAFTYLLRFESKKLKLHEKQMLVATMFQHSGYRMMESVRRGEPLVALTRLMKHSLTCSGHLQVETEPMQLARLVISLASRRPYAKAGWATVDYMTTGTAPEKNRGLGAYMDEPLISGSYPGSLAIDKFPLLNISGDGQTGGVFGIFGRAKQKVGLGKGRSESQQLMSFELQSIPKALLRSHESSSTGGTLVSSEVRVAVGKKAREREKEKQQEREVSTNTIIRLFEGLQVVMGDKLLNSLPVKMTSKNGILVGKFSSELDVVMGLLSAGVNNPNLVDEMYTHLCKQLTDNPTYRSRLQGWLLFSVYLHYLVPSPALTPHLLHFIRSEAEKEAAVTLDGAGGLGMENGVGTAASGTGGTGSGVAISGTAPGAAVPLGSATHAVSDTALAQDGSNGHMNSHSSTIFNITLYCTSLLMKAEVKYHKSSSNKQFQQDSENAAAPPPTPNRRMVELALSQVPLKLDVQCLTGSVYQLQVKYGHLFSPCALLPELYSKMVDSHHGELDHIKTAHRATNTTAALPGTMSAAVGAGAAGFLGWTRLFRGFSFYYTHEDVAGAFIEGTQLAPGAHLTGVVNGETATAALAEANDMQTVPVQPVHSLLVDWETDLAWHLLALKVAMVDSTHSVDSTTNVSATVVATVDAKRIVDKPTVATTQPTKPIKPTVAKDSKTEVPKDKSSKGPKNEEEFESSEEEDDDVEDDDEEEEEEEEEADVDEEDEDEDKFEDEHDAAKQKAEQPHEVDMKDAEVEDVDKAPLRLLLRRTTASATEVLAHQLDIFGDIASAVDSSSIHQRWLSWLKAHDQPTPFDSVRVDLLFAEDTRYVNAGLYAGTEQDKAYLLGLQLALSWEEDVEADTWGEGHRRLIKHTDLSVRPIYQRNIAGRPGTATGPSIETRRHHYHLRGRGLHWEGKDGSDGFSDHYDEDAEVLTGLTGPSLSATAVGLAYREAAYRNRNQRDDADIVSSDSGSLKEEEEEEEDEFADNDSDEEEGDDDDFDDEGSRVPKHRSTNEAKAGDSHSSRRKSELGFEGNEQGEEEEEDDDEFEEEDDDEFEEEEEENESSYVTSDDDEEDTDNNIEPPRPKCLLLAADDLDAYNLEDIRIKLGLLGIEASTDFVSAVVDNMVRFHAIAAEAAVSTSSPQYRYLLKRAYVDYIKSWPLYGSHFSSAIFVVVDDVDMEKDPTAVLKMWTKRRIRQQGRPVLVCVSVQGLFFLDPEDWAMVFHTPLCDIESFSVVEVGNVVGGALVHISINGMDIKLVTEAARELQGIMEACCMDALAHGSFPLATGTTVSVGAGEGKYSLDPNCENIEAKIALRGFLRLFVHGPFPVPPMPPVLQRKAGAYFRSPRSKRQILAQEKAEEEILEAYNAKLAADMQAERQQMRLEQGRKDVKRFDKDGEGSDVSDDEKEKSSKRNSRKIRRNSMNMSVNINAEKVLYTRVVASVSGVTSRKSRFNFSMPATPLHRGVMHQLDTQERPRAVVGPAQAPRDRDEDRPQPVVSYMWPAHLPPDIESLYKSMGGALVTENKDTGRSVPLSGGAVGHHGAAEVHPVMSTSNAGTKASGRSGRAMFPGSIPMNSAEVQATDDLPTGATIRSSAGPGWPEHTAHYVDRSNREIDQIIGGQLLIFESSSADVITCSTTAGSPPYFAEGGVYGKMPAMANKKNGSTVG